ncbi:MAG: hypothetical protein QM539_10170 [Alphaproteobacteria bacterium]|nr:hypothetical protein [Alphaproteobacteria bacterium]
MVIQFFKKYRKIFLNGVVLPILIIYFGQNLYQQIKNDERVDNLYHLYQQIKHIKFFFISILVFIAILRFAIDTIVWKKLTNAFEPQCFSKSLKSVFLGELFSFNTPLRAGNFIGKIYFLKKENFILGTFFTLYGNFVQKLITFLIGFIALTIFFNTMNQNLLNLNINKFWIVLIGILIFSIFFFVFYKAFYIMTLLNKWGLFKVNIAPNLESYFNPIQKLNLMALCLLRYVVIIETYIFIFYCLNYEINYYLISLICIFLLCLYFIPSFFVFDILIRAELGILIFDHYIHNKLLIIAMCSLVWVLNIFFPALIGFFIFIKINYLKKYGKKIS